MFSKNNQNYRKIWETYNNKKIPDNYEIHHIDGNRNNNNPENLLCVSIHEHLEIHKKQNDWAAVQAILARIENRNKNDISYAAREAQKKKLKYGNHNFQLMTEKRRTEISKKTIRKRIKKYGIAFLGIPDIIENSRKAGKIAAEKKAGFLNVESENHGSKYVKNTYWWINIETGKKIRSFCAPNEKWKKGMKI